MRSGGVLGWDQRVMMPSRGTEARANALATIGRLAHDMFVDDEVGRLLDRLQPYGESLEYDSDDASLIRVTRHDWEKERRCRPTSAPRCCARRRAATRSGWRHGQERLLEVRAGRREAPRAQEALRRLLRRDDEPYTALLDDYEPFMTTTEVGEVFDTVKPVLSELVKAAPEIDASFLYGSFRSTTSARSPSAWCGRWDSRTTHGVSTRPSTLLHLVLEPRRQADDAVLRGGSRLLLVDMHEAGHGLYAHGIADSLQRTPLAAPVARPERVAEPHVENLVGRSRPFWEHWYEPLQETFPDQVGDVSLDAFLAGINRAEPGLIRVEADETTYSLHIILRFDLERRLIDGSLSVADLPEAWNAG